MKNLLIKGFLMIIITILLIMSVYPITSMASKAIVEKDGNYYNDVDTEYGEIGESVKLNVVNFLLLFFIGTVFWLIYFWVVKFSKKYIGESKTKKMHCTSVSLLLTVLAFVFNILGYVSIQSNGLGYGMTSEALKNFNLLIVCDLLILAYVIEKNIRINKEIKVTMAGIKVEEVEKKKIEENKNDEQ